MATKPPDFKASGIRAERLISSGSAKKPQLLIFNETAAGNDGIDVDTDNIKLSGTGSDTWMFVSGSIGGNDRVTFGGDVVISGTLFDAVGTAYVPGAGGGGGDSYWTSLISGNIFTTGSAYANFLSSSLDLEVTGSTRLTGSLDLTGSAKIYTPDEGTLNLVSSLGESALTHVSDGNLYLSNLTNSGQVVIGATNSSSVGKQLLRLEAGISTGNLYLSGTAYIGINSSDSLYVNALLASDIIPDGNRTRNLGSESARFANIYTGDLHLRNERGNWTIIEEEDFLCVVNNTTGKKYKMMLEPM